MSQRDRGCPPAMRDQLSRRNLRIFCAATGADFDAGPTHDLYKFEVPGRAWDGTAPAIRILPLGRFGNNILQTINAIHVANVIGSKNLYLDLVNIGAIDRLWETADLILSPFAPPPNEAILCGSFFYRTTFKCFFVDFEGSQLAIVSNTIGPMLRNRWRNICTTPDHALHIHIRSGDIFTAKKPHPNYVPPPLSYYKKAISHFQQLFRKPEIVIVAEDWNNPYIDPLCDFLRQRELAIHFRGDDFEDAVGALLSAKNLITSVGTFAPMIALASNCIRRVYAFRQLTNRSTFLAKGTNVTLVRDRRRQYIARDAWANTPNQLRQMIDYPEEALQIG